MSRASFADKLIAAADDVDNASRDELQVLLRRAALRIRNELQQRGTVVLEKDILDLVEQIAAGSELDREATVNALLRDWLIGHGMMPPDIRKDTETKGALDGPPARKKQGRRAGRAGGA